MSDKGIFKDKRIELTFEIFIMLGITMLVQWFLVGFRYVDFKIPLGYDNDALTGIVSVKNMIGGDANRMGWPFHEDNSAYSPVYNALYQIFIYAVGLFVKNPVVIQNVYIFCIPVLNALVAFLVFRGFLKYRGQAYLLALIFGLCPYVQWRSQIHFILASVECVPIVFMICIWLCEDAAFNCPGKGFFKNKKNLAAILFAWMIANNGMVYYPFFTCFLLAITALVVLGQEKKFKAVVPTVITLLEIVGWLALGFLPSVIGSFKGAGGTATNGATRDAFRSTVYGLDIKSLFLAPHGFGIQRFKDAYTLLINDNNENKFAYIGVVAIIGLCVMLFVLLTNNKKAETKEVGRILLLSKLTVATLILSVSGGLGVLVAIFVPYISCYNRMCPYIVFAALLAFGLAIDEMVDKFDGKIIKLSLKALTIVFLCVGLLEQSNVYLHLSAENGNELRTEFLQDQAFFTQVESVEKENSMIYMLPYMSSFENGPAYKIPDYEHYKGYLHSNNLRFSYGATKGSENDEWYRLTDMLPADQMVVELVSKGFAGIYINLDGYADEDGAALVSRLKEASNCEAPIFSENGRMVYITLKNEY